MYNEKRRDYSVEYAKKNLKRVPLDMPLAEYKAMKEHVDQTGESVNGFIRRIIKENI